MRYSIIITKVNNKSYSKVHTKFHILVKTNIKSLNCLGNNRLDKLVF